MKFKLISFYSDVDGSTFYSDCAKNMISKCEMLNINYHIEELPSKGSYGKNTLQKPQFILDCFKKFKEPLLWVDVDSIIWKKPLIDNKFKNVDFSGIKRGTNKDVILDEHLKAPNNDIYSSPLFFNNTENAKILIQEWAKSCFGSSSQHSEGDHEKLFNVFKEFEYVIETHLPARLGWMGHHNSKVQIETILAPANTIISKKLVDNTTMNNFPIKKGDKENIIVGPPQDNKYKTKRELRFERIKRRREALKNEGVIFKEEPPNENKAIEKLIYNPKEGSVKINLFDGLFVGSGRIRQQSSCGKKETKNFEYIEGLNDFDGITIFTDNHYDQIPRVNSKFKIAWQVETPLLSNNQFYDMVEKYQHHLDMIFTYDEKYLRENPKKFKRSNFGGTTVLSPTMFQKSKEICIVHSGKNTFPGHKLRKEIITATDIPFYGRYCGEDFEKIEDVYADYKYVVVVENYKTDNYFTEKITDAIACGCIPIYYGAPNIDTIFNGDGIIQFNSISELITILNEINNDADSELYNSKAKAIKENFKKVLLEFNTTEDWLFEKYMFKEFFKSE